MKLGDYLFMDNDYQGDDIASIRKMMIQNAMTEIPEILQSLDGKQLYQPKQIFVITDPGTFSAAFHYAFYLHKMGATLVGVPSGQAPNTFMEVTPFTLPCSGLSASISNTLQQFFPKDSPLAKELIPDVRIMSQDYARYNLDADTPVLKILDICRGNDQVAAPSSFRGPYPPPFYKIIIPARIHRIVNLLSLLPVFLAM